jgi:hypothetical protein
MHKLALSAALALGVLVSSSAAQACSLAEWYCPAGGDVIEVANGCGVGWHRTYNGICRPNHVAAPYVYGPPSYGPHCWWVATAWGPRRVCAW